ncbi:MAG: ABC transporter permease [SAR324 cluster bacterium]|nr:ABC transporter permease [SAR324 cluster bacterium]
MNFSIVIDNIPLLLDGLWVTLHLISLSLVLGFMLALPLALIRHFKVPVANQLIWGFTYFFRSTPLILQIYLIYYGTGQFSWIRDSWMWVILEKAYLCGLIAFTLNTAAYTTEIFRNALDTMRKNEIEAAIAFGMSTWKAYTRIVIPNSLRRSIPPYSNEVIFLLHSSSIASAITITELTGAARYLYSKYYDPFTPFLAVSLVYLVIVFLLTYIFKLLERRFLSYLSINHESTKKLGDFGNP